MVTDAQAAEIEKYSIAYGLETYRMGPARKQCATDNLQAFPHRDGYLDVGCGRGEMLGIAEGMGFSGVQGTEVVPGLVSGRVVQAVAWDLPFGDRSFDLVTLFDVIEHLLPEDTERTLHELGRVARKGLFITAANYPSKSLGVELHVNRRPYDEWDPIMRSAFPGGVTWLPRAHGINSETWRVDL